MQYFLLNIYILIRNLRHFSTIFTMDQHFIKSNFQILTPHNCLLVCYTPCLHSNRFAWMQIIQPLHCFQFSRWNKCIGENALILDNEVHVSCITCQWESNWIYLQAKFLIQSSPWLFWKIFTLDSDNLIKLQNLIPI